MEEKYMNKNEIAEMIGDVMSFCNCGWRRCGDKEEYGLVPGIVFYYKNMIEQYDINTLQIDDMLTMITDLNDVMQDEEFTYNLFLKFFKNNFAQFMNLLSSNVDVVLNCVDLVSDEFPDIYDVDEFCSHFTTVEDYIRLYPSIYNILYDAFYTVVNDYNTYLINDQLGFNIPNEIINIINNYELKYDKAEISREWYSYNES